MILQFAWETQGGTLPKAWLLQLLKVFLLEFEELSMLCFGQPCLNCQGPRLLRHCAERNNLPFVAGRPHKSPGQLAWYELRWLDDLKIVKMHETYHEIEFPNESYVNWHEFVSSFAASSSCSFSILASSSSCCWRCNLKASCKSCSSCLSWCNRQVTNQGPSRTHVGFEVFSAWPESQGSTSQGSKKQGSGNQGFRNQRSEEFETFALIVVHDFACKHRSNTTTTRYSVII